MQVRNATNVCLNRCLETTATSYWRPTALFDQSNKQDPSLVGVGSSVMSDPIMGTYLTEAEGHDLPAYLTSHD
jgi:hypothetical protein